MQAFSALIISKILKKVAIIIRKFRHLIL
jgi:hypothetical protein